MNFTNEQLTKAKAAKSAEELLALAKENGVEMTEEEAAKYLPNGTKRASLPTTSLPTCRAAAVAIRRNTIPNQHGVPMDATAILTPDRTVSKRAETASISSGTQGTVLTAFADVNSND